MNTAAAKDDDLVKLRELLEPVHAGRVPDALEGKVRELLANCWDRLPGSEAENTTEEKVWRAEDLSWEPPCVCFTIERHGRTVGGSSRADLHDWVVDIHEGTAACRTGRHRQLEPMDARWDAAAAAREIADKIRTGMDDERLRWSRDRQRVTVLVGKFVTARNNQTLMGRRKRFRKVLQDMLNSDGWELMTGTAPNTFRRLQ